MLCCVGGDGERERERERRGKRVKPTSTKITATIAFVKTFQTMMRGGATVGVGGALRRRQKTAHEFDGQRRHFPDALRNPTHSHTPITSPLLSSPFFLLILKRSESKIGSDRIGSAD